MKGAIALIFFMTSLTVLPVLAQENPSSPELGFGYVHRYGYSG